MQELIDSELRVFVLWSPILPGDNRFAAEKATIYLNDPRVEHFWDLWSFGVNHFTKKFNYPEKELAWDIFVLYSPGTEWILPGPDPDPYYWMQHRGLDIGPDYTKQELQVQIEKLLN